GGAVGGGEVVLELRAGGRVAVREVEAADADASDRRLEVPAVHVLRVARQSPHRLRQLTAPRHDGDPVPALLSVPDRVVAGGPYRFGRKPFLRRLELLQ